MSEPFQQLPGEVTVSLDEVRAAINELELVLGWLRHDGASDDAAAVDDVIGRMTRWLWPLLRELDQEGDR